MVGGFDEPLEHRMRVDFKYSGYRPTAQAFRQRPYRPHQQMGRHTLAMKDGVMGLQKVAPPAAAMELPPGATVGMTVGTAMASPKPAARGPIGSGAELARGVDLTVASLWGDEARGRGTG